MLGYLVVYRIARIRLRRVPVARAATASPRARGATPGASLALATSVNDVAARDIDRINHPRDRGRPLVTGEARERELVVLHALATALALAFCSGFLALATRPEEVVIGYEG